MNRFNLPYNLIVEEGVFEYVDLVMANCVPGIAQKKVVIVTESALLEIFKDCLAELQRDFKESELYLVEEGSFDTAVELAKYVCMNQIGVIIGFGGGKVLDIAKYAGKILVMNKSELFCYDTVENVFRRSEEIEKMGLDVPQITKVFNRLKELGIPLNDEIYTVEYAKNVVLKLFKERGI